MAETTGIAWTDATFNPWWGCTKVGPGCDHCYAERDAKRYGFDAWGHGKERRFFGDKHWQMPVKLNAQAQREGRRIKVFCASMADVFDREVGDEHRARLFDLIKDTPSLDWQIVTKRIGNAARMLPPDWGDGYANVWLIATAVDQAEFDRDVPKLLATPARIRGLSIEPQLGPVDLYHPHANAATNPLNTSVVVDWVITGGESGPNSGPNAARFYSIEWARALVRQCRDAGVACFVKQLGSNHDGPATRARKADDPSEWPADLRVRNFPQGASNG